jgi:hypothetical protein
VRVVKHLDALALEDQARLVLGIQKIGLVQVAITLGIAGAEAGGSQPLHRL